MKKIIIILVLFSLLISCDNSDSGNSESKPVAKVFGMAVNINNATDDPLSGGATAFFDFFIGLENASDNSNVNSIRISAPSGSYWSWDRSQLDSKWSESDVCYSCWSCYSSSHLNSLELGVYTVTIENGGNESSYNFTVFGRNNESSIYGSTYSEALSANPQLIATATNCSVTENSNVLTVNFQINDDLAEDAYIWIYDSNGDYLGYSDRFSDISLISFNNNGSNTFDVDVSNYTNVGQIKVIIVADVKADKNIWITQRSRTENIDIL